MLGVTFIVDGVELHSWKKFQLRWVEPLVISSPEIRRKTLDIPGRNGLLDISDLVSGLPTYKNRSIQLNFESGAKDYQEWGAVSSSVANALHGKMVKIILDTDKAYYYTGIASVSAEKSGKSGGHITVDVDAYPFKITVQEDKTYRNIVVSGSYSITIPKLDQPTVPTIVLSNASDMYVTFNNSEQYLLGCGNNRLSYIVLGPWRNELRFIGNGTLSVIYERGML